MNDTTTTKDTDYADDISDAAEVAADTPEYQDTYSEPEHHVEEAAHHYVEEHEERSSSLAGRLLTYLVVLLAGAALALWGGPKLAPQLPEWAAPAAKYMTPGGDAALQEVTALRSDVDTRLAEISEAPDTAAITAEVQTAVAADLASVEERIDARVEERLNALADQVAATDSGAIEARIAQAESRIEGIAAELSSLTETVSSAAIEGGTLSADAMAALTANAGKIDGLRAELEAIAGQNGELAQRIDNVEATADRKVAEAEASVAAATAAADALAAEKARQERISALVVAAKSGAPFAAELDAAAANDISVPASLTGVASEGIKSIAALRTDLAPLAHEAIRASIKSGAAETGGTLSKLSAFLESQVATRSLNPSEGDGTDAVLSRIEAALTKDDLTTVLTEADTLQPSAKSVLDPWLANVTARRDVLSALETLGASAS